VSSGAAVLLSLAEFLPSLRFEPPVSGYACTLNQYFLRPVNSTVRCVSAAILVKRLAGIHQNRRV